MNFTVSLPDQFPIDLNQLDDIGFYSAIETGLYNAMKVIGVTLRVIIDGKYSCIPLVSQSRKEKMEATEKYYYHHHSWDISIFCFQYTRNVENSYLLSLIKLLPELNCL